VDEAVPVRDGEGRADGAVPGHFDVEAHAEDAVKGARWRWTRRSWRRWVCG
jgi:hypothetical protein